MHPPERFLAQLRTEYEATAVHWSDSPALRILPRALSVQDSARQAAPIPSSAVAPRPAQWTARSRVRRPRSTSAGSTTPTSGRSSPAAAGQLRLRHPGRVAAVVAGVHGSRAVGRLHRPADQGLGVSAARSGAVRALHLRRDRRGVRDGYRLRCAVHPAPAGDALSAAGGQPAAQQGVGDFSPAGVGTCWIHRRLRSVLAFESVRFCGD